MACTGNEKRPLDPVRNKWLSEVGNWAAAIIAWIVVLGMGLAVVCSFCVPHSSSG